MDKNKQPRKINLSGANIVNAENKNILKSNSSTFKHNAGAFDYENSYKNNMQNYNENQKVIRQIKVDEFSMNESMLKNNNINNSNSNIYNNTQIQNPKVNSLNDGFPQNKNVNNVPYNNVRVSANTPQNSTNNYSPEKRALNLNANTYNIGSNPNISSQRPQQNTMNQTQPTKANSNNVVQTRNITGTQKKPVKKKGINILLNFASVACAIFLIFYAGLQTVAGTVINTGEFGTVSKTYQTPPQYANNELNLLVLGIDYTSIDGQGRDPNGNTDVIMYVRFNFSDNTIRMLQIPRDVYVGEEIDHGGTGKIATVYGQPEDDKDRVNSLAYVLYEQYKLPVDNYVSIDMDSLRSVVDLFGGVEVYIEHDMYFQGSSIEQGWQLLDGDAAEFFVRYRDYPTGDIARLGNQRNFYSALFSMVRSVTWQEIVRLTPIVQQYINTDLSSTDCAALAIELLRVPSSNILLAILPVSDAIDHYNGEHYISIAEPNATADLLNEYFRAEGAEVPVEELNIPQLPKSATLYNTNVQWMAEVDENTGIEAGQAADETVTGEDILDEIEQEQAETEAEQAAAQDNTE